MLAGKPHDAFGHIQVTYSTPKHDIARCAKSGWKHQDADWLFEAPLEHASAISDHDNDGFLGAVEGAVMKWR